MMVSSINPLDSRVVKTMLCVPRSKGTSVVEVLTPDDDDIVVEMAVVIWVVDPPELVVVT